MTVQLDLIGIEAVQAALLEVPSVVDSIDDPVSPVAPVLHWMRKLETVLAAKRQPLAGSIASFRAVLVSAENGRIHKELQLIGKPGRRRLVTATATLVLEWTVNSVVSMLEPEEARYREARGLAMRLVAVAQAKGVVSPSTEDSPPGIEPIISWLDSASADPDLLGGFANLAALVGRQDSLKLLAEALENNR
jgi:hypothetical protein